MPKILYFYSFYKASVPLGGIEQRQLTAFIFVETVVRFHLPQQKVIFEISLLIKTFQDGKRITQTIGDSTIR